MYRSKTFLDVSFQLWYSHEGRVKRLRRSSPQAPHDRDQLLVHRLSCLARDAKSPSRGPVGPMPVPRHRRELSGSGFLGIPWHSV